MVKTMHNLVMKCSAFNVQHSYPIFLIILINETYACGFFVCVDMVNFLYQAVVLINLRDFSFLEPLNHKIYHTVHLLIRFPVIKCVFYQHQIGQHLSFIDLIRRQNNRRLPIFLDQVQDFDRKS